MNRLGLDGLAVGEGLADHSPVDVAQNHPPGFIQNGHSRVEVGQGRLGGLQLEAELLAGLDLEGNQGVQVGGLVDGAFHQEGESRDRGRAAALVGFLFLDDGVGGLAGIASLLLERCAVCGGGRFRPIAWFHRPGPDPTDVIRPDGSGETPFPPEFRSGAVAGYRRPFQGRRAVGPDPELVAELGAAQVVEGSHLQQVEAGLPDPGFDSRVGPGICLGLVVIGQPMQAALLEPAPAGLVERQHRVEAAVVAGASPHGFSGGIGDQLEPELLALGGPHGVEVSLSGPADDTVNGAGEVDRLDLGGLPHGPLALDHRGEVVNQERQRPRNTLRGDHPQLVAAHPGRGIDLQPQGQHLSLGGLFRWVAVAGGRQFFDALNGGGHALPVEPDGIGPLEGLAPQRGLETGAPLPAQGCNGEGLRFRSLVGCGDQQGHHGQDLNSAVQEDHVSGPNTAQFPDSLCLKGIQRSK